MYHHHAQKKPYTELCFDEDISSSLKIAKKEVADMLHSLRDRSAVLSYNGQIVTAMPIDFPRLLVEWETKSHVHHAIRNIVVSSLLSSEEKCVGSALIAAGMWIASADMSNFAYKKRCKYEEMKSCLAYCGGNGMTAAAALNIVEQGGLGCKVAYEETSHPVTRIFAKNGRVIVGDVDPLFGDRVGRDFSFKQCVVVAIDGTVESVANVHQLMTMSLNAPVLIMAKNFLPDVSNTMAEAWRTEKAKCLPFTVHSWGVESFLDLEQQKISCVSPDRGDTFSSLKIESLGLLDVTIERGSCVISGNDKNVNFKLIVEVSQALGGVTGLAKDRIKMLVGHARQCARNGVTKWESLSELSQHFLDLYSKDLVVSSSSVVTGYRASKSMTQVLQEIGCLILVSKGEKA